MLIQRWSPRSYVAKSQQDVQDGDETAGDDVKLVLRIQRLEDYFSPTSVVLQQQVDMKKALRMLHFTDSWVMIIPTEV